MRKLRPIALFCAALAVAGAARAQDNFFAGKQINLIIASTAGGGQDSYGRLVARHLSRHVPGNPVIVAVNSPGAAGRTAVRSLDVARKDGTNIVTFTPPLVIQSLMEPQNNSNYSKFAWIGSIGREARICFMWSTSGVSSWEAMLKKDVVVLGDTGGGGQTHLTATFLKESLGAKIKLILGYPGIAEKRLAIERGELDGDCGTLASIPDDWMAGKKIVPILRLQDQHMPGIADSVPYIGDLVRGDADKSQLLELLNSSTELGRPFIAAGDVPADRIETLRAAFDKMTQDPQFTADAAQLKLDVTPIAGADLQKTITRLYATPTPIIEAARKQIGM